MNDSIKLDKSDLMEKFDANELTEYLKNVIDTEMQKPTNQMNTNLIGECVDWTLELDDREVGISAEVVKNITKSIIDKHYKPRKKVFNVLTVIAACILLAVSVQFVSMTAFHENLFEDVYEEVHHLYDEVKHIIYDFTHHDNVSTKH